MKDQVVATTLVVGVIALGAVFAMLWLGWTP